MAGHICSVCGAGVGEGYKFCTSCGTPVQGTDTEGVSGQLAQSGTDTASVPSVQHVPPPVRQPAEQPQQLITGPMTEAEYIPPKGSKYEPISTRGFLGIWLLMLIPLINLLLIIVWACGGCQKINKRNFARAALVIWGITFILCAALAFMLKSTFDSRIAPAIAPYLSTGSLNIETPKVVTKNDSVLKWPDTLSSIPMVKGGALTVVDGPNAESPDSVNLYYINLPMENLKAWRQELGAKGFNIKNDSITAKNIRFNGKTYPQAEIWYEENGTNEWNIYFDFKK